jgi:hypothetical protein
MPNGGTDHCGHCASFDADQSRCSLRGVAIESSHWTTCRNWQRPGSEPDGPLFAIVCQVRNRVATYGRVPYFRGNRADTIQPEGRGDTVVRFRAASGELVEVASVDDYLDYCRAHGQSW